MTTKTSLVIGVLAFVSLAGIAFGIYTNRIIKQERAINAHTQSQLSIVYDQRDSISNAVDSLQIELAFYKAIVDSLDVLVETNETQIANLNKALDRTREEIEKWTPDDVYNMLQTKYITDDPDYIYPFSGKQTKLILEDVIASEYKDSLL